MPVSEVVKLSFLELFLITGSISLMYGISKIFEGSSYRGEITAKAKYAASIYIPRDNMFVSTFQLSYEIKAVEYTVLSYLVSDRAVYNDQMINCVYNLKNPNDIHTDPEKYRKLRVQGYQLMIAGLVMLILMVGIFLTS